MAESRQTLQSPAAVKATRLPRQIKAVTPLTAEETREEHARSEAAIAEVEASAGPDGWGEIGAVPSSPKRTFSRVSSSEGEGTISAPMNASRFAAGRLFPEVRFYSIRNGLVMFTTIVTLNDRVYICYQDRLGTIKMETSTPGVALCLFCWGVGVGMQGIRNNTFDRFPVSYAPTCPCHGANYGTQPLAFASAGAVFLQKRTTKNDH
jgi:hypothetical protein